MIVPSYHAPTVSEASDLTPGSDEQIPYNPQGPVRVSVVVQDGDRPRQRTARSQVTPKRVVEAVSNVHRTQQALCISGAGAGDQR